MTTKYVITRIVHQSIEQGTLGCIMNEGNYSYSFNTEQEAINAIEHAIGFNLIPGNRQFLKRDHLGWRDWNFLIIKVVNFQNQ